MSTEQEKKRARLLELMDGATGVVRTFEDIADRLMASGEVDVTLPPEPQWKPGQYVMLTPTSPSLGVGHTLARREYDSWVTFEGWLLSDDEVTDVEPVAVLTAEDVRELRGDRGISNFTRFFAERGLDL